MPSLRRPLFLLHRCIDLHLHAWCRCKALLLYYKMTELVSSICNGIKIGWHRLEGNILLFWCYLRIAKDNHEWHSRWDDWIECLGMFWLSIFKVGFVIFVRIFALFIRLRLTFFAHCLLVFVWQIDRLDALVHEMKRDNLSTNHDVALTMVYSE